MSEPNKSVMGKEFESVTPMPLTDTEVGTVKDTVSSDDELLRTIGYKQVRGEPILSWVDVSFLTWEFRNLEESSRDGQPFHTPSPSWEFLGVSRQLTPLH
jgi:hypothetical protein